MPTPRRLLWLGPYAADLRGRAVDQFGGVDDGIWIVPTPLARDQLVAALTRRGTSISRPRVFAWDDLWAEVARRHRRPPAILSEAAARAAMVSAIDRARADDALGVLGRVADLPGLRRELRGRFAAWSLADRRSDGPPPQNDAVTVAALSIFRHYRAILVEHFAEDAPGLASWSARALADGPLGRPAFVAILDPVAPSKAQLRAIEWAASADVLVTLPWTGDPDDPAVGPLWEALGKLEFEDEEYEPEEASSLADLERSLFSPDPHQAGPVDGLSLLGGPRGEGLGLILAREVARRIERGVSPDEILVLVRRWDDDAARAVEILGGSGIPVSGGPPRPLATDPAVAALLLAASIAVDGWETASLVRLLRNGRVDPGWSTSDARAEAASVLQTLRVFRGRQAIASALDRGSRSSRLADRARRARDLLDRLAPALDLPATPATWTEQANRLRILAETLGLDSDALGALHDALDDHALIRDVAARPIDRGGFVRAVGAIAGDIETPRPEGRPGAVPFATVDKAEGARARVIVATNLVEGTFPTREAVAGRSPEADETGVPLAYARERLAFLRLIGSARDEVILLVPTSDEKGQELLPAGFVDDLIRHIGHPEGLPAGSDLKRLDPIFLDHPDLALNPADARVFAVARAVQKRDTRPLLAIVHDPAHRRALEGVASGLRLVYERMRVRHYNEYDGLLSDPKLVVRIAADFGPEHAFSPSQIESFALCPFQFYQRYVLRLDPVDDRPELRDDHAARGDLLHKHLEEIHAAIASEFGPEDDLRDRVEAYLLARLDDPPDPSASSADVASALRTLEEIGLHRTLGKYAREFAAYHDGPGTSARPRHFEWSFGLDPDRPDAEPSAPALVLGIDGESVRLRGKVDRIDLLAEGFRVIDYKTGHAPSSAEVVKHLRAVQLPLYALAVERLLVGGEVASCDFGYWTLGRDGFAAVDLKKETWPDYRARLIAEVVRLVAHLRRGAFPVEPKRDHCRRFCDYRSTCRLTQVLAADKEPETRLKLLIEE